MPRGDEAFISCDDEQFVKVFEHPTFWVALCEMRQYLRCDRTDVVILVRQSIYNFIPCFVRPIHGLFGFFHQIVVGFELNLPIV